MRVVAFNGSSRPGSNTSQLIAMVTRELEAEGIETQTVEMAKTPIRGCIACYQCFKTKDTRCAVKQDELNDYLELMLQADGIILGTPVYFSDMSATMKGLIERAGMVCRANGDPLARKVGAGVVAVRRAGATRAFDSLNAFFFISQMIVPGSRYWNLGRGLEPGDVAKDDEGVETMSILGQNMAWLMKKLHA